MSSWPARIRWGVIDDARSHQHRRHRRLIAAALLAIIVALVAYAAFGTGGARTRFAIPPPGMVTGSLAPLSPSAYQYWVTPSLSPGSMGLDIDVQTPGFGSYGVEDAYAAPIAATVEILSIIGFTPRGSYTLSYDVGAAPIAAAWTGTAAQQLYVQDDPEYVLLVAPNVAAIAVGKLGVASARSVPGLPAGDKLVVFRLPASALHSRGSHGVNLTALNDGGSAITPTISSSARADLRQLVTGHRPLAPVALARLGAALHTTVGPPDWTTTGGSCAVTATVPGLTDVQTYAAKTIALSRSAPGSLLSCVEDTYAYRGAKFNVAILLNGEHPGSKPPPLWGATPLAGHPGTVEIKPPPRFAPIQFENLVGPHIGLSQPEAVLTPLFARRNGNAWLIVQPNPGSARNPSQAQTLQVLNALRITRIDLPTTG